MWHDVPEHHKIVQSTDFEALKLLNIRSGIIPMMTMMQEQHCVYFQSNSVCVRSAEVHGDVAMKSARVLGLCVHSN